MPSRYWIQQAKRHRFILVLTVGALIAVLVLLIYYLFQNEQTQTQFRFEGAKLLLQFIIIVLLGGILVERYNNYRDRVKAKNEFRKDLFVGMMRAYNDTKKVRRSLRASIVQNPNSSNEEEIPCIVYEQQLELLNDPQLEFEFYEMQLGEVPAFKDSFANSDAIRKQLRCLEDYLNDIIKERNDTRKYQKVTRNGSCRTPRRSLEKLDKFIKTKTFRREFVKPFRQAVGAIQNEITRI